VNEYTLQSIRAASPFPWASQVNFDGQGGCRMIDGKGVEVPLMHIIAFSGIMSATLSVQPAQAQ
jgi:hypothetical protein